MFFTLLILFTTRYHLQYQYQHQYYHLYIFLIESILQSYYDDTRKELTRRSWLQTQRIIAKKSPTSRVAWESEHIKRNMVSDHRHWGSRRDASPPDESDTTR